MSMSEQERLQVVSDLKAAREELVRRGRTTGEFTADPTGPVCLVGAIGLATNKRFASLTEDSQWNVVVPVRGRNRTVRTGEALADVLAQFFTSSIRNGKRGIHLLWEYNDRRSTTDQDVLDLMDKAIADLGGMA